MVTLYEVPLFFKAMTAFLLLASGIAAMCADAQVAPFPYAQAPIAVPDRTTNLPKALMTADMPKAFIKGWSFGPEMDTKLFQGGEATLESTHPEIVLFFDDANTSDQQVEFRYRLTGSDLDWTLTRSRIAHYR